MFMYGAVHGLKYGVAMTGTCRNDGRLFHAQVKSCSILSLRQHRGRSYCLCRFQTQCKIKHVEKPVLPQISHRHQRYTTRNHWQPVKCKFRAYGGPQRNFGFASKAQRDCACFVGVIVLEHDPRMNSLFTLTCLPTSDVMVVLIAASESWMTYFRASGPRMDSARYSFSEEVSSSTFVQMTTGDTEDELAIRKTRNCYKAEIHQWNIPQQATILDLAQKNRNAPFRYVRHCRKNESTALDEHLPLNDKKCVHMSFGADSASSFVMYGKKGSEDITRINVKKDLGIWLSSNMSFSLHLEKSAKKAFAFLRMIQCTFSRVNRMDFQILYGTYIGPLLEYTHQVVYSGPTKDVTLIERV
ncbi:hypothetical protein CLF_105400 [Clonorchis sinensis]|uniref:Uncharacterized protein n=1 Tax=Clonorchis sinensis TaxID=79923 RepID=G7YP96_CLOSI|nr:hypothetical protein CLF_105400 [Clonorchis sinensis]